MKHDHAAGRPTLLRVATSRALTSARKRAEGHSFFLSSELPGHVRAIVPGDARAFERALEGLVARLLTSRGKAAVVFADGGELTVTVRTDEPLADAEAPADLDLPGAMSLETRDDRTGWVLRLGSAAA